ncbi:MAG: FecR domain-containing protein [Nitrospirota bacterium]
MNAQQLPLRRVMGILLGILVLSVSVGTAQAGSSHARIIRATGTVEVSNVPSGQWVTASSQTVLPPGSSLRTGSKSTVVLELDGATVTLYETSLIRIPTQAVPASTATSPLRHPWLDSGRGLFDVTPRQDRLPFSVHTPTIVAGVKGTVFEVSSTGTEEAVYVWDGLVEVTSRLDASDLQLVGAGQFTVLDDLKLTPASPIPADRARPEEDALNRHRMETALSVNTTTVDLITQSWRDADQAVFKDALDGALDFQTVVSLGTVRVSTTTLTTSTDATIQTISGGSNTLMNPLTSGVSSGVDAVAATALPSVDSATSTVSSSTGILTTTLSPVTDTLTTALSPVVDSTTATVSSVVTPLTTLGF